jgi:uncharacterized protein (DUF2141 family)
MKRIHQHALACVAAALLAPLFSSMLAAQNRASAPPTCKLSGRILGASGKKVVYVALWRSDDFLKTPIQQTRIQPGADLNFAFTVPPGRWAISAFEDRNGNGILDMGVFGPREPSGFWHTFNGWHKPQFEEVASTVQADTLNADITLK